ncbi:MAG: hypothetical protein U0939_05605 [Pirellulales bacterium]
MSGHDPAYLWRFLFLGYVLTVALEAPVLAVGLAKRHGWSVRAIAALWLTACTYPIVVLVLPLTVELWWGRTAYVTIAELFAPLAECLLFWLAFDRDSPRRDQLYDALVIIAANLTSFLIGLWLHS